MTTYTSQPDGTDGIDAKIQDDLPTTNFGTSAVMRIGYRTGATNIGRALIKFDLSKGTNPPPSDAIVVSASLWIACATEWSSNARSMRAYRVLRNWTEAGVTWNKYDGTNNWGTAGCANTTSDREAADIGSFTVPANPTLDTLYEMALTASKVQEWISGTTANYGVLLKVDTESDDGCDWHTSDATTAGYRPKLTIEYTTGGQFITWTSM